MGEDDAKLIARFTELSERAERTSRYTQTKFLNMAEQSVLLRLRLPCPFALRGGYEGAERRLAYFGSEEQMGYRYEPPIVCIEAAPVSDRFSDELTHRDFLGALMALGIVREVLGDIVVSGNRGYIFCLESVAGFIVENLTEVKRTSIACRVCDTPEFAFEERKRESLVVASERLDAVIAAVYKLPREKAKQLCEKGLVYINARLCEKAGSTIPDNAAVSVRGFGRFVFLGTEYETKKGRLRVRVEIM